MAPWSPVIAAPCGRGWSMPSGVPYRRYVVEYQGATAPMDRGARSAVRSVVRRETVRAASPTQAVWRVATRCGGTVHRVVGREL